MYSMHQHSLLFVPKLPCCVVDDSALRHKERLLEFDRTAAQRTAIHDDQEDYFVAASSMWSSEQEQEDARIMEEERRKKLHERQKQTLNINF